MADTQPTTEDQDNRRKARMHPALRLLLAAALGAATASSLHRACLALGSLYVLAARDAQVGPMLPPFGAFMGWSFAIILLMFFFSRVRRGALDVVVLAAALATYLGIGWIHFMHERPDGTPFGDVLALHPGGFWEMVPSRPRVWYTVNSRGFRGPEWSDKKAPGTIRIVTIGDSYVFGSGVADGDTLAVRLSARLAALHPNRKFEVLNLGIPGDNVTSHVDVYRIAKERLAPDVAIIGLTLPNDTSRWDGQDERREPRRPGLYGATSYLFGKSAAIFGFGELRLETGPTEKGIAHLRAEMERLAREHTVGTPLLLLPYNSDSLYQPAIKAVGDATIVDAEDRPEYFIPGDGHPTAAGNAYFSELLAASLDRLPAFQSLLRGN